MEKEQTLEALRKLLDTMNVEDALLITTSKEGFAITYGRKEEYQPTP